MPGIDILLIQCYSGRRPQKFGLLEIKKYLVKWTFKSGMKTDAGIDRAVPIHSRIRPLVEAKYKEAVENDSPYLLNWIEPGKRKKNIKLTYVRYKTVLAGIVTALNLNPEHRPHDGRTHFVTAAKRDKVDEYAIKYTFLHFLLLLTTSETQ